MENKDIVTTVQISPFRIRWVINSLIFSILILTLLQFYYNYITSSSLFFDFFIEVVISTLITSITIYVIKKMESYSGTPSMYLLYSFSDTLLYLFLIIYSITVSFRGRYGNIVQISIFLTILEFYLLLYKRDNQITIISTPTQNGMIFRYLHKFPLLPCGNYKVKQFKYIILRHEGMNKDIFSPKEILKPVLQEENYDDALYSLYADTGICDNYNNSFLIIIKYKQNWVEIQKIIDTFDSKVSSQQLDIQNYMYHNGSGFLMY